MSEPRFPSFPAHKGHYESYYLRAADPAGGRSAWIRHTVFKRPGQPAEVAPAYLFLASEVDSSYVTGQIIHVDGGQGTDS